MKKVTKSMSKTVSFNEKEYYTTIDLTYINATEVIVNISLADSYTKVEFVDKETGKNETETFFELFSDKTIIGEDVFNIKTLTVDSISKMVLELIQKLTEENNIESQLTNWDGKAIL